MATAVWLTDEQLDALEEMAASVAIKGPLLRGMIDEIRGSRNRIHRSHTLDEHCIVCGAMEEQLSKECKP